MYQRSEPIVGSWKDTPSVRLQPELLLAPRACASSIKCSFENLLLFAAGGALGLLLALACIRALSAADYLNVAQTGGAVLDLRVLSFAASVSLLTGLLFGLVPAWKASRSNFNDALKTGGTGCDG